MSNDARRTRREILKRTLVGSTMLPFGVLAFGPLTRLAGAAELPLVDEADPTAIALGYLHDAGAVDVDKFPKRAGDAGATQFCDNCALYKAAEGADKGACAIFPGKSVAGKGWCNSWVIKP